MVGQPLNGLDTRYAAGCEPEAAPARSLLPFPTRKSHLKGARRTIAVLLSPKHSQRSRLLSNLEKTKQFAASALREDIMAIRNMRSARLQGCCTPSNSGRNRQTLGKATRKMPLIPVRVQFYTVQNAHNKPHCIHSMFAYMYKQISATINFQKKKVYSLMDSCFK